MFIWINSGAFGQKALSDQYWQKAEKLAIDGKYEESLPFYEKAYELIKNTDPFRAANLCNDMSSAHYGIGQYQISTRYCHKGLLYLKNRPDAPDSLYFKLYSSLATMHSALKQLDSSSYYFLAADDILDRNVLVEKQIPLYVLHHYLHQGRAFWVLHRYHQSITYFTRAKALSESYALSDELAYIDSSIAEAYDLLGEHREALKYRLASTKYNFKDTKWIQAFYAGVGYTYQRLNMLDSALHWQQKSWNLHLTLPRHTEYFKEQHINLLFLIGSLYRKKGEISEAHKFLELAESYRLREFSKDILVKSLILIEKGYIASSRQQLSRAESYFLQAYKAVSLPTTTTSSSSIDLVYPQAGLQALLLRANILYERYKSTKNFIHLFEAYQAFSALIKLKRTVYIDAAEDTEERYFLSFESYDLFKEAIPMAYVFYHTKPSSTILQEIFSWFEEANATYLYEVIEDKKIRFQKLSPSILAAEQKLLQKRASLIRLANSAPDSIKRESDDLRIQWYKLRQDIRKKYPSAYHTENESIQLAQVQQRLEKESAFISYKWFDGQMYALVVTTDTTRLLSWAVNKDLLKSHLSDLQAQFNKNPGFGNYKGTLSAIGCYKMLFEPVKKWIARRKRLVIARDWQFNFLPFEVLESGSKTDNYLAKDFAFSYTYSASFFWQHPFRGTDKTRNSLTIAPFVKEQILPNTTWSAVSRLADIRKIGGEVLWGNRATKQRLLGSGLHYNILHFATHAHSADDNPNDSFIQLFPGIDSRIYLNEIYTLPLHSTRLVVLTACSAGSGKNLRGEGNISLAHAIAQAGCPSVITTTWEANDAVSGYLSLRLHRYLNEGLALDQALQRSRLDFFENEDFRQYQHPYYWANLTLIGNNEPVYDESVLSGVSRSLIFLLLISLASTALINVIRNKRRIKNDAALNVF